MVGRILIVYYSWSGNTRRVAQVIHEIVGGDLVELEPVEPYPESYSATLERAKKEIRAGLRPPLKTTIEGVKDYDTIFVGSPNWWGTIAPPVTSFLSQHNLSGKTVVPFFTHGGGGLQKMLDDLKKLCPQSKVLQPLTIYEDGGGNLKERVRRWLIEIGALSK
ncbi:MAG: flavodoxin [Ignisphaera sp.]|nr:NAD(P)H-dependent oxidoreductase [Ignisphaera sp.]MDW8086144.1 flavodoxin [Ignisphaera sp.]